VGSKLFKRRTSKGFYSLLAKELEDEDACAYVRYVWRSKEGFESVLEFIDDDKSGNSRTRRTISADVTLHLTTTDEPAMNDAHALDALLYGHMGL
jgi:hypothetical protein